MSTDVERTASGTIKPIDTTPPITGQPVTVVDVRIPFGSMVKLLLTLAVASIPAVIILSVVGFLITAILAGMFQALTL